MLCKQIRCFTLLILTFASVALANRSYATTVTVTIGWPSAKDLCGFVSWYAIDNTFPEGSACAEYKKMIATCTLGAMCAAVGGPVNIGSVLLTCGRGNPQNLPDLLERCGAEMQPKKCCETFYENKQPKLPIPVPEPGSGTSVFCGPLPNDTVIDRPRIEVIEYRCRKQSTAYCIESPIGGRCKMDGREPDGRKKVFQPQECEDYVAKCIQACCPDGFCL
jgi:hypothetical protein